MNPTFLFQLPFYVLMVILFFLIVFLIWFGYLYKKRRIKKYPGQVPESMGSVEASVLGVMSLMLGFTFSVAMSKYETRRLLTVEEANDIGTSILRCDLYPDSIRNALRADFKDYIETRIAYYNAGDDEVRINRELNRANLISGRIWRRAVSQSHDLDNRVRTGLMIPVLNNMIDIVTTRDANRISRIPSLVIWVLLVLVLTSAFILGADYTGKRRNKILIVGFALIMTLTLNLIAELNRPRRGLINLDAVEQKMIDLREMVK